MPDQLLFVRQGTIFAQPLDPGRLELTGVPTVIAEQVAFDPVAALGTVSTDGHGLIAYRPSGGTVQRRYIWFDRNGTELQVFGESGSAFALSPDSSRLAFARLVDGNTDLWVLMSVPIQIDPNGETLRPGAPVPLFTPRLAGGVVQPVARQQYIPSPDGARFLVNTATRQGNTSAINLILNWKPKAEAGNARP